MPNQTDYFLKSLLDNLFFPLAVFSLKGSVIYSNSAFDSLFKDPSLVFKTFPGLKPGGATTEIQRRILVSNDNGRRVILVLRRVPASTADFSGSIVYTEDVLLTPESDCIPRGKCIGPDGGQMAAKLSKKESEIVFLIYNGLSAREISDNLSISVNTAKTHIKKIYRKLGVQSRIQLLHLLLTENVGDL